MKNLHFLLVALVVFSTIAFSSQATEQKKVYLPLVFTKPSENSCQCDQGDTLDCTDFDFWWKARVCYERCTEYGYGDVHNLDENNDGTICTTLKESEPLKVGSSIYFYSLDNTAIFEGSVMGSQYRDSLIDNNGNAYYPQGVYVVSILSVKQGGKDPAEVNGDNVKIRDSTGQTFDQVDIFTQIAAEDEYGYKGRYYPIQPGETEHLVFVFDVLTTSKGLYIVGNILY